MKILKKNAVCCLLEVKENESNEIKLMKIYSKNEINISKLLEYVNLLKKLEDLKVKNVLLYDKYIINENYVIFVMKKYENNLEDLLNKRELKRNEINEIMLQLLKCIKVLEETGFEYNNLKLSNILLDGKDDIMIVDNLKYLLIKDRTMNLKMDIDEMIYLSPEILKNEEIDIKSDIWNIGIIYYKLLTKSNPYDCNSLYDLIKSILEYKYENNNTIEDKYNSIICKLLVDKENRMNIDELIKAIDSIYNKCK